MKNRSTLYFRLPILFILYFIMYYGVEMLGKQHILSNEWGTRIQIALLVVYFFVLMGILLVSARESIKR